MNDNVANNESFRLTYIIYHCLVIMFYVGLYKTQMRYPPVEKESRTIIEAVQNGNIYYRETISLLLTRDL